MGGDVCLWLQYLFIFWKWIKQKRPGGAQIPLIFFLPSWGRFPKNEGCIGGCLIIMLSVLLSIFRSGIYINRRRNPLRMRYKHVTYMIDPMSNFWSFFFSPILESTVHNISASTCCSWEVILWIRRDRGNTSSARCRAAIGRVCAPSEYGTLSHYGRSLSHSLASSASLSLHLSLALSLSLCRQRCSIYLSKGLLTCRCLVNDCFLYRWLEMQARLSLRGFWTTPRSSAR